MFWPKSQTEHGPRTRLRAVLGHELAHIKRRGPIVAHLELIGTLLWRWNPLFWYVRARIHEYAELACDAWARRISAINSRSYAETLIDFKTPTEDGIATLAMSGSRRRAFHRRLTAVMQGQSPSHIPHRYALAIGACTLLLSPMWTVSHSPFGTLVGTTEVVAEKTFEERRADRNEELIEALGQPESRDRAARELISFGSPAVTPLILALPKTEKIPKAKAILDVLGPDAGEGFPRLFTFFHTCASKLRMPTLDALNFIAPFRSEGLARDIHPILQAIDSTTAALDLSIALNRLKFRTKLSPQRSIEALIR